jgi:energy-coupling factor transport system ATP-binding protein
MSVAVRASDLAFRFPEADGDTLRHVNWVAEAGSVTLVVGPSGGGKSTFLRCLNGLVPHFHGGNFGGLVEVAGHDTRRAGPRDLAGVVGVVFQDPEAQFVTERVDDEIAFGMENLGIAPNRMRVRLEETLDLLGIADLRRRAVATLSGGERQKVAIASALALGPRLLLLDEPTSQLDPLAAQDVLGAVERLNADLGLTVVIAEHRLDRILPFADQVVSIAPGRFDCGPTRAMLTVLDDVPPLVALARRLGWQPLPLTVRDARRFVVQQSLSPAAFPNRRRAAPGDPLVIVRGLVHTYERKPVLRDVTFEVREGEVVALMGRNGSGKTTLLRHVCGLLRPARGRVLLGRPPVDIGGRPVHEVARVAGYVPQHPTSILHRETVYDELAFTARAQGRPADIAGMLEQLRLRVHMARNPLDLSGGERQRVALAALAVTQPAVLLLDEPTRGLPWADKQVLAAFAREYAVGGRSVVIATHDVDFVARAADRVLLLADGEIVADGAPEEVLAGSLAFAPQINRLLGGAALTLDDALAAFDPAGRRCTDCVGGVS